MCIATAEPAERVAAALAPLGPLLGDPGTEVVIAVDDRVERATLDAYAAVADRVLLFPYADPPSRSQPWLFAQCRGRWVFRLDADEVPSPALAEELVATIEAERFTHAYVPRRWIGPSREDYIAQWPWLPDYQLRLLLRDPAVSRVAGELHAYAQAVGARRYLDAPLYHLDLALNSLADRRRKAERYDGVATNPRIAGREFNESYYLPEDREDVRTAPIPGEDADAVRTALAPPEVPLARAAAIESATADDLARHWLAAPIASEEYAAELELLEGDLTVYEGEIRTVDVRVRNLSRREWPWSLDATPQIRLAHVWTSPDGERVEGLRTPLPFPLRPGEDCRVPVQVSAPPRPGTWTLGVDLVHEHVRWFGLEVQAEVSYRLRGSPPRGAPCG